MCVEPIRQLNTVGATIEFPSTVTSSAPSGNESTVTSTLGSELAVSVVVEVTDVVVPFVVLVVVETAVTRKSRITAMVCFEAGYIIDPPEGVRFDNRSIISFFTESPTMLQSAGQIIGRFTAKHANRRYGDPKPRRSKKPVWKESEFKNAVGLTKLLPKLQLCLISWFPC